MRIFAIGSVRGIAGVLVLRRGSRNQKLVVDCREDLLVAERVVGESEQGDVKTHLAGAHVTRPDANKFTASTIQRTS